MSDPSRVPTRTSANSNSSADVNTLQAQIDAIPVTLTLDANAYVDTNVLAFAFDKDVEIQSVYVKVDNAPTGADLQLDVNKNGTTIFTTQGNRPIIAAGTTTDETVAPDVTDFTAGDICSVDIDQVGSTVPGGDKIYIIIRYQFKQ